LFGTEGRTRTGTLSPAGDFESPMSTNFITSASFRARKYNRINNSGKCHDSIRSMKLSDFHYDLPEHLIAQYPPERRGDSRLLCVDGDNGQLVDSHFSNFIDLLQPNDLLVFNNTRVIPARLFGRKQSGGKVEILIERIISSNQALAHIRASKSPKPGSQILLEDGYVLEVTGRDQALFKVKSTEIDLMDVLIASGHMPLPPYITRDDSQSDIERYQTIYAEKHGAVAAPTAGLHFTDEIFEQIDDKGIDRAFVTLHVGAGTFQPVRVENLDDHVMHKEYAELDQEVVDKVNKARSAGGRVVAVGTTSVRTLESAAANGELTPFTGDTQLFIKPGFRFNVVDAMLTNFHLPESTLLMLVSAFAGYQHVMKAYQHAVQSEYRFFSYGDAMWLSRQKKGAAGEPRQIPPKEDGGCAE
jgi:S-adenosylmethionine:tRNA ribosyltransferase-isomerase